MPQNPFNDYLTIEEVADQLKRSDTAIKNWTRNELKKAGLAFKKGRLWLIHKSALPLYKDRPKPGRPLRRG